MFIFELKTRFRLVDSFVLFTIFNQLFPVFVQTKCILIANDDQQALRSGNHHVQSLEWNNSFWQNFRFEKGVEWNVGAYTRFINKTKYTAGSNGWNNHHRPLLTLEDFSRANCYIVETVPTTGLRDHFALQLVRCNHTDVRLWQGSFGFVNIRQQLFNTVNDNVHFFHIEQAIRWRKGNWMKFVYWRTIMRNVILPEIFFGSLAEALNRLENDWEIFRRQ